ncbi:MAG: hypothetical protein QMD71_01230 [bacterium]|nr:hypothetical protein [bacterium]
MEVIVDEMKEAGCYSTDWNTKGLANGVYFCKLECNGKMLIHKSVSVR